MTTATLAGATCTHVRVDVPSYGRWWADVRIAGDVTLSGAVELVVADTTFRGAVAFGGSANGRSAYRVVGGAGGWGTTIGARDYANDAGVRRATLVADAATACGETVDTSTLTDTVGPHYVRDEGPAAYVLDHVAPRAWRVDADGVTRFGARTASTVTTTAPRVRVDRGAGAITLASPTIAALVPGAVVDALTAVDVRHELTPEDGLRTSLYGSPWGVSRRIEAIRRLVRSLLPEYRYHGTYEFRIAIQESERVSLQPVRSSVGLPDLRRVPIMPGIPGARADHQLGAHVAVTFLDGDPARPIVVSFADADSPGFVPTKLSIGEGTLKGVARLGDQAGPYTIISASSRVEVE